MSSTYIFTKRGTRVAIITGAADVAARAAREALARTRAAICAACSDWHQGDRRCAFSNGCMQGRWRDPGAECSMGKWWQQDIKRKPEGGEEN